MLSSALLCVSRLVTGLLFTFWVATSGPGYKYCVWFLVSHLSAALGVHGEHSFAQVCFSSADRRWQAESRHQPAMLLLDCCWGLAPGLQNFSWAGFHHPLQFLCLIGLHLVPPQLLRPHEGAAVSPGAVQGS